ncbi:MAG: CBS domain-containing protein [Hyphomicrobiales bacterium]
MTVERTNIIICPNCGAENIEGTDICENCLMDLRTVDVPDTVQVASDSDLLEPISSLRLREARTVPVTATLREVIKRMHDEVAEALIVMKGADIAGIFTERDVLKRVVEEQVDFDAPISRYMTPDPVALRDDDTMATALNKMGDGGFRHIPVTNRGQLIGVLGARDVMNWVMSKYFG